MKKLLAQIVYWVNIVIFLAISGRALYGCYLYFSGGLLAEQQSLVVGLVALSIVWFFFTMILRRKIKSNEKLTDTIVWGAVLAAIPGILLFLFLFLAFGIGH